MFIPPDYTFDRVKLKKQLMSWRLIAMVLLLLLLFVIIINSSKKITKFSVMKRDFIARVYIDGVIYNDYERIEALKEIAENDNIKAVVMHINSPGGTIVGGESLYHVVRKISETKPVVSVVGDIATSAAYMTAVASDYIVTRGGTLTGSIGVLFESFEVTELAKKIGIKFNNFKSSPLKGAPFLRTEELTPDGREAIQSIVNDTYEQFLDIVSERRHIKMESLLPIANGRVYTGKQAFKLGLIDAIGDETTALEWLKAAKVDTSNIVDIQLQSENRTWLNIINSITNLSMMIKNSTTMGFLNFF